jgi:effector-binding domain-containing protein
VGLAANRDWKRFTMTVDIRMADPTPVAFIAASVERDAVGERLAELLPAVYAAIVGAGGEPAGAPYVRYLDLDASVFPIEAGLPVTEHLDLAEPIQFDALPGGRLAVWTHTGPYDQLADSWRAFTEWLAAHGEGASGPGWESYLTDPGAEPDPSRWITELVVPLK